MQAAGLLFVMMIVTHGGYGKETVSHTLLIEKKVEPLASKNRLNHERSSLRGQEVYFVYIFKYEVHLCHCLQTQA